MPSEIAADTEAPPVILDDSHPRLPPGMHPVERAHVWVLRAQMAMSWLPLLVGALVVDNFLLEEQAFRGVLSAVVAFFAIGALIAAPRRIWRRIGYRLNDKSLRIVRGWLFHVDTIVPFVRVQHIDVARGPLEKIFGTASLVVHTAGTHNSVVSLPGLDPDQAASIRETIRAQIKTDWQ